MRVCLAILIAIAWFRLGLAQEASVPDSVRKYRFLAKTARENRDYAGAIAYYKSCLKFERNSKSRRQVYYFLGQMNHKLKDFVAAGRAFLSAAALDSMHTNTNIMLFEVFRDSYPDTAAQALERLLMKSPKELKRRRKLADFYRRQGRIREAITHYSHLATTGRDVVATLKLLADLHDDLGEAMQALNWRRRLADAQTAKGLNSVETLELVAESEIRLGDYHVAYGTLLQLVEVDSVNRASYFARIVALGEQARDNVMVLRGLEGTVKSDEGDLSSLARLAEWHLKAGDEAAARRCVQRGLRVDGENAHLHLLLGDLLTLQGNHDEAVSAFSKAQRDPTWQEIAQQRIWQLRPPETEEEILKKAFFGGGTDDE